jgi:ABC-type antimicrobial peptide transport system permease subunit
MALGSTRPMVVRHIVAEQTRAVLWGLAAGGVVAALVVRALSAYLYKTELYDPYSWVAAIGLLLTVALISAALPSARATRIDLVQSLKPE